MSEQERAGGLPDDLIDTRQAAKLMKTHVSTIWRWALAGKIPSWRRGGRLFVSQADLLDMFKPVVPLKDLPHPMTARELSEVERKRREKDAETQRILKEARIW